MAIDVGLNFRSTSTYVTDGNNETYVLGETTAQTRTTGSGVSITFQWTTGTPSKLDRDSAGNRRLAGMNYTGIGAGVKIFTVDLSSITADGYDSASALDIYAAHGDHSAGWTPYVEYRDDTTVIDQFQVATGGADRYDDAQGVAQANEADWIANSSGDSGVDNKQTYTFTTSSFRTAVGFDAGTDLSMITHLRLVQTATAAANRQHAVLRGVRSGIYAGIL